MNTLLFVAFVVSAASASVLVGPAAPLALAPQAALIAPSSAAIISGVPTAKIISGGIVSAPLAVPALSTSTIVQGPSGLISTAENGGVLAANSILAPSLRGWPLGQSLWV